MSSLGDEDAVLQELGAFLNIEDTEREPTMPSTIQKYHKIIASNNEGSIFDYNYDQDNARESKTRDNSAHLKKKLALGLFTDDKVIRVQSGRGRGVKTVFKSAQPAQPKVGLDSEELIYQQLRKVNPIGYSNEVTENSVRQIRQARSPNNNPGKLTPSLISSHCSAGSSKSSSPATMYDKLNGASSNLGSRSSDKENDNKSVLSSSDSRSTISIFDYENDNTYVPSASGCGTTASESTSSISKFAYETDNASSSSSSLNPSAAPFTSKLELEKDKKNINKPLPEILAEVLRESREQKKRFKESQQLELRDSNAEQENELASQKKIQEILRQDMEDDRKQKINGLASQPPDFSGRTRTPLDLASQPTNLWWTNSPPRRGYTNTFRNGDQPIVNIKSTLDFPPLK